MAWSDLVAGIDAAALSSLGGEDVIYQPSVGDPVTVTGIFESNFPSTTTYGFAGGERSGPTVWLRIDELPSNPDTDDATLTIRGISYKVRDRDRDGAGSIHLSLVEAAS